MDMYLIQQYFPSLSPIYPNTNNHCEVIWMLIYEAPLLIEFGPRSGRLLYEVVWRVNRFGLNER
ncbi:hypothetical protein AKJ16_DCAP12783 [Drosera capensis]